MKKCCTKKSCSCKKKKIKNVAKAAAKLKISNKMKTSGARG